MSKVKEKLTVCIFVSSTFSDMESERDIINNQIINQLREDFAAFNVDINFIDLRWGINTTDVNDFNKRNEKILKVCMSEIDRCHPYFISLIGQRYGWIPSEDLLFRCFSENDIIQAKRAFNTNQISVTALETYFGLFKDKSTLNRCFLCLRDDSVYNKIPSAKRNIYIDDKQVTNLKNFKEQLVSFFKYNIKPTNLINYGGEWNEKGFIPNDSFYSKLYNELYAAIKTDIQHNLAFDNEFEQEIYFQDLFFERTINGSLERKIEIEETIQLLQGKEKIILHAPSGQGKSTFLCQLNQALNNNKLYNVILYSSTASINSSQILNFLEILSYRITKLMGGEYEASANNSKTNNALSATDFYDNTSIISKRGYDQRYIKEDLSSEQIALLKFINLVNSYQKCNNKPLILLVDGLDRFHFSPLFHSLQWLKSLNVRVVTTTTTNYAINLSHSSFFMKELPSFRKDEAIEYIKTNCNGKDLHKNVIEAIVNKKTENASPAFSSPLWLRLIIHMLNSLDITDFYKIELRTEKDKEERIHNYMYDLVLQIPPTPGDALLFLIGKAETYLGYDFSTEVLKLLAFSEFGLREKDLEFLMEERWSSLDFAMLRRWIRPYLIVGEYNQWKFAHHLFEETIKANYIANSQTINDRLLKYCYRLPENDILRQEMGMSFAINAKDRFCNAVFYYTYQCRLAENIQKATNILIEYLQSSPEYMLDLLEMHERIGVDGFERHMAERMVFTLGNQLYKSGLFKLTKQLYQFYEPILESNASALNIGDFLLPMLYTYLIDIFENEYNVELVNKYKQKKDALERNNSPEDLSLDYATILNELAKNTETRDLIYSEELYLSKYKNNDWYHTALDELLHSLGKIYASLSCPPEDSKLSFWKEEFNNAILQYHRILPNIDSEWDRITQIDNYILFKFYAALYFMEFLVLHLIRDYKNLAIRIQKDCLGLYELMGKKYHNEHYFDDCALGYSLAGKFFFEIGERTEAIQAMLASVQKSAYAQKLYPNSIRIKKRYVFANHNLGTHLFMIAEYKKALAPLTIYLNGVQEIFEREIQSSMLSSFFMALQEVGRCHLYLTQYENALLYFHNLRLKMEECFKQSPRSQIDMWLPIFHNTIYFIARTLINMGEEERGYKLANNLYDKLIRQGIPADSDYEPVENLRELLEL